MLFGLGRIVVLETTLGQGPCLAIFGKDYSPEDGTCVRDYIHVNDFAQAHLLGLEKIMN